MLELPWAEYYVLTEQWQEENHFASHVRLTDKNGNIGHHAATSRRHDK